MNDSWTDSMSIRYRFNVAVALCICAATARATDFAKVLLPVVIQSPVAGAYHSLWATRFTISNPSNTSFFVVGYDAECPITCVGDGYILPHTTFAPMSFETDPSAPGILLRVETSGVDKLGYELRVQDLSRDAETWGTEIPIVKESHALTSVSELLDVPLDPRFRDMLRMYDFDPAAGHSVLVRYIAVDPNSRSTWNTNSTVLAEKTYFFSVPDRVGVPGYVAVPDIANTPELSGYSRLRVEVTPLTSALRYWAFVSVTNNATQHVTLITPQ
jgi:hypothetical protein